MSQGKTKHMARPGQSHIGPPFCQLSYRAKRSTCVTRNIQYWTYLKDITSSVAKRVPLTMILLPLFVAMLEKSKGCHNEGIMRSLQEVIKRPLKGIIPMRGFWWFIIHVPGMWHMARSPSGTFPWIICWSVPVTLLQVLWPLQLLSDNTFQ